MKQVVQTKLYPIQITRATYDGGDRNTVEFNLNNINWAILKNRIDTENAFSLSTIFLKFPPGGETVYYRKYEDQYSLNTVKIIPPSTEPVTVNVENYLSTPLTGSLNKTTDYDLAHPFNTFMAIDEAVNPTNISGFMWIKCNISPYVVQGSQFWNQNYAWFRLAPDWKVPSAVSIEMRQDGKIVTSVDPRRPIDLSWISNIQDDAELQVWQDGNLIKVLPIGASKTFTVPGYTIPNVGQFTFTIAALNNPMEDLGITGKGSISGTAAVPAVTASNFKINQLEKRTPIVGTWDSTNQSDFKLEVIRGGVVEYSITGGTEKTFTIPPGALQEGAVTFRLTVNNTFGTATTSAVLNLSKTIVFSKPLITSLEPDGLNQNLDLALSITWICDNQGTYNLKVYREGVLEKEFAGTVEKSITLPPKTLKTGNIKTVITITNTINGITGTSTREADFFGYGTPDKPVFEDVDIYNQALPLIKWATSEQEYYDFKILSLDGTVYEASGEILSASKQYQVTKDLVNNTQYKLALRIKSSFGLWSDWTEKIVSVIYSTLPKPQVSLQADAQGNVIISINNPANPQFKDCELWRKAGYEDWVRIAKGLPASLIRNDSTVGANLTYLYRVVANSLDGGRTQSDPVSVEVSFEGFYIVDLEDVNRRLELLVEDTVSESPVTINTIGDEVATLFAGATAPILEKGVVGYQTASMKFLLSLDDYKLLEDMKKTSKLLLYKDERGNKLYGNIQGNLTEVPKRWFENYVDVNFNYIENSFSEKDLLTGTLTLVDGGWVFA